MQIEDQVADVGTRWCLAMHLISLQDMVWEETVRYQGNILFLSAMAQ